MEMKYNFTVGMPGKSFTVQVFKYLHIDDAEGGDPDTLIDRNIEVANFYELVRYLDAPGHSTELLTALRNCDELMIKRATAAIALREAIKNKIVEEQQNKSVVGLALIQLAAVESYGEFCAGLQPIIENPDIFKKYMGEALVSRCVEFNRAHITNPAT